MRKPSSVWTGSTTGALFLTGCSFVRTNLPSCEIWTSNRSPGLANRRVTRFLLSATTVVEFMVGNSHLLAPLSRPFLTYIHHPYLRPPLFARDKSLPRWNFTPRTPDEPAAFLYSGPARIWILPRLCPGTSGSCARLNPPRKTIRQTFPTQALENQKSNSENPPAAPTDTQSPKSETGVAG